MKNKDGLMAMAAHYESEINRTLHDVGFKRELGLPITDEGVSKVNEKLYRLIMFRNNMLDLLNKREENDQSAVGQ